MTTEEFHRKLTAILSADVVGYSRLMGDDEASTVKILETYKAVMFSLIRQHRGRVVDSPGDNLLAEFGSVVDAVQCAVSIQKELQTRNADLSENRRMEFRIGINLGDVIEEEDRIYGDGVNIAARLEALADPGGICISKTAFDHIESKLPLGYEFLGEQTVKNIAKPVGAYKVLMETRVVDAKTKREAKAVSFWRRKSVLSLGIIVILAIAAVLYWNFYLREPSIEPKQVSVVPEVKEGPKTIAVLLFDNVSSDPEQDYFAYGLSEEILNGLCQIPDLGVIGKTSSFSFQGTKKTIQEIASDLGVDHILEGSVRKAGNALRITVQLIRASDGLHLWSETYDRELKDIFVVQEDIAKAVADELKSTLGVGDSVRLLGGTDNLEAYELYLVAKGQDFWDQPQDWTNSLESTEAAIALDPEFALAWSLKAQIHINFIISGPADRAAKEEESALNAAQTAIELEPKLANAYNILGFVKTMRGDWIEAESAYRKALELTVEPLPGSDIFIPAHYTAVGNFKRALELLEAARRSDPLNQDVRTWYYFSLGLIGDTQRAEEEYERCTILFGDQISTTIISRLRIGTGNIVSGDEIISLNPIHETVKENLETPENGLEELRRIYTDDDNLSSDDFYEIALGAAYFGDPEFSMDAIMKVVDIDASGIFELWFPVYGQLRQLPRFKKLIREIGLVDYWNKFGWPDICHQLDNGDFKCE